MIYRIRANYLPPNDKQLWWAQEEPRISPYPTYQTDSINEAYKQLQKHSVYIERQYQVVEYTEILC